MSRIRSTNTSIDKKMNSILSELDYEFLMYPKMYGNPDFVIPHKQIIIFCDGDFWHGYNFEIRRPTLKKYWIEKIEGNMKRDKKISRKLRYIGWSVLRFWEHDLKKRPEICIKKITKKIKLNERLSQC